MQFKKFRNYTTKAAARLIKHAIKLDLNCPKYSGD